MPADATIAKLVEKQMRNWELSRQQRVGLQEEGEQRQVADFVSISREVAAGGRRFATALAERLGWPVFDKELLTHMADDDQVRARLYEHMDERDTGWIERMLRWLVQGEVRREDYVLRLYETVLALARQSHAVFLGRGAELILPQDRGLRLRLIAPEDVRLREYARRSGCDEKAARSQLGRLERERAEYIRRTFGRDPAELARFDLILNLGSVALTDAVELAMAALRLRGVAVDSQQASDSG